MKGRRCSPAKYFSQNFRPLFEAPGYFDRSAAKSAIVKARELMTELQPIQKRVRQIEKELRNLQSQALKALENADPRKSP
jgi:hypothetical protein